AMTHLVHRRLAPRLCNYWNTCTRPPPSEIIMARRYYTVRVMMALAELSIREATYRIGTDNYFSMITAGRHFRRYEESYGIFPRSEEEMRYWMRIMNEVLGRINITDVLDAGYEEAR
ncbi:hypothetical protein PMAYCL1PPCAC_24780, partial [Pristionchus mayeri]